MRTRPSRLPSACAAWTNSRSRKDSTAPRTTRAYTTQLETPMTTMMTGRLGPSLTTIICVIGVSSWVVYARIVRGAALSLREREFVQAAQALGSRDGRILLRHVLPNVFTPWLVVATLDMARVIVIESALSFLGLGVQPPTPTWGGMLADGRVYISTAWWLATFPGLAILVTVLGINLFGDGLRDTLDPRLKV